LFTLAHVLLLDLICSSAASRLLHPAAPIAHVHLTLPPQPQVLTYWLCYLFCRCTRSVSYASPAYYAHLAAGRGKLLTEQSDSSSETSSETSGSSQAFAKIHSALNNTMFYV
jgi:hypothetical protein